MTPHRLREVAGTFSSRTSTTFDGFHPRELSHLSEDALGALATIFATAEVAATWPRQVSLIVAALLPKPKGGYRPIGMAPAVYRLWSKARRVEADEWERQHARPFFSACQGNGPLDTVWRLAAKQECGAARGEVAATISEDIHAFFETVDRDRLVAEARALGFPLAILRAALAEYSAARVVSMHGRVGRELYPTVGVVAGCSLAMVLTKVCCLRAMDRFVSAAPRSVHLDTFVDDLVLSTIGKPNAVIDDLECAHGLLKDMVNDDLRCQLAPGKAAVTSTTRTVAAALGRKLGIGTGVANVITILGVDNTAAAPRAALRCRSKKAARLRAALARRRRLQQVQRAVGQRAKKVFVTGLLPQATYGAAIWGMDEGEAIKLRRLAAASLRPHGRCRSLHTTLLWHGAPTAAAEIAPVLQMARMVWQAITRRSDAEARGASIADLRQWWEEAMEHAEPLVKRMEAIMKDADDRGVDISVAASRRIWRQVTGPVGAMALTAARLRWKVVGPFVLHDQWGAEHLLTNTSPAMVKKMATEAVKFDLERKIAKKRADKDPQFVGRRACVELVMGAVNRDKTLSAYQRGVMRGVVCGSLMTGARAQEMGYDVDALCPLCRRARDTLTHRVYECPHSEEAVKAAVPDWFWTEARRTAAGSSFWTTGICPNPADLAPPPDVELTVTCERLGAGDGQAENDGLMDIKGWAYIDGSATTPAIRGMARAGCAIVNTDDQDTPLKILRAAVPRHLPQTAQAAEFLAYGLVVGALRGQTTITGDCLNVINAANGHARNVLAHTKTYAGILLSTIAIPERRRLAGHVRWTRAHQKAKGDEPPDVLRDIKGNDAADAAAKEAVGNHPSLGTEAESQLKYFENRAPHVVRAVVAALRLFPRAPGNMVRAAAPTTRDQAVQRRRHFWQFSGGQWRCTLCHDWTTARQLPRARRQQRCRGVTLYDDAEDLTRKGHAICWAKAAVPFAYCSKCGAWGHRRTYHLAAACGPPKASGLQALSRIRKGLHPMQRRGPGGLRLARERIATTAVYCRQEKAWRRVGQRSSDGEDDPCTRRSIVRPHIPSQRSDAQVCSLAANRGVADTPMIVEEHVPNSCGVPAGDSVLRPPVEWAPAPPAPMDVELGHEDDDVFGFGGSLDQPPGERDQPAGVGDPHHGTHTCSLAGSVRSAARNTKSIREDVGRGGVKAAVERLMAGTRTSRTDSAERMKAIRRRVIEREQARVGRVGAVAIDVAVTEMEQMHEHQRLPGSGGAPLDDPSPRRQSAERDRHEAKDRCQSSNISSGEQIDDNHGGDILARTPADGQAHQAKRLLQQILTSATRRRLGPAEDNGPAEHLGIERSGGAVISSPSDASTWQKATYIGTPTPFNDGITDDQSSIAPAPGDPVGGRPPSHHYTGGPSPATAASSSASSQPRARPHRGVPFRREIHGGAMGDDSRQFNYVVNDCGALGVSSESDSHVPSRRLDTPSPAVRVRHRPAPRPGPRGCGGDAMLVAAWRGRGGGDGVAQRPVGAELRDHTSTAEERRKASQQQVVALGTLDDRPPKRRRLRGKQPAATAHAGAHVDRTSGSAPSADFVDAELREEYASSIGGRGDALLERASNVRGVPPQIGDGSAALAIRGGPRCTDSYGAHSPCVAAPNSANSGSSPISGGPSRLRSRTATSGSVSSLSNRDGHELHARSHGGTAAWPSWGGRPPDVMR